MGWWHTINRGEQPRGNVHMRRKWHDWEELHLPVMKSSSVAGLTDALALRRCVYVLSRTTQVLPTILVGLLDVSSEERL
jgi:hypothetical protein